MSGIQTKCAQKGKPIAVCLLCVLLLSALSLFLFSSCEVFLSDLYLDSFLMEITLEKDGTADITETAQAHFTSQDSDWYNFYRIINDERALDHAEIDGESFMMDGKKLEFVGELDLELCGPSYWKNKYADHAVGYYFIRPSGLEIGVVMPAFKSGTHTFSYRYKVKNVLFDVVDSSVFYYQYVSEINTMDIKNMDVTILFPEEEPDLRAWLHVSQNAAGAWKATEGNAGMTIHVEDIKPGEYIETRALLDKGHYILSTEPDSTVTALEIENEEGKWYDKHKRRQALLLSLRISDYVIAVLAVAFAVVFAIRMKKKNKPLDLPDAPIYYRDIPNDYTGGEVSPLYFYYSNENYLDESISATMLELTRLHYLSIVPNEGEKSAIITVLKQDEDDSLRTHQKLVLDMLLLVKPLGESFSMKQFERFGKTHPTKMMEIVNLYKAAIGNKAERLGAYPKNNYVKKKASSVAAKMVVIGILGVMLSGYCVYTYGIGMFFASVGMLIGALVISLIFRKDKAPLTLVGQKEYNMLHALSRFMQEFSMMDEHEIPELVLWEDYMVFATAMGIADKVAEQLEIKYPEFRSLSSGSFDADRFVILYFFSRSFCSLSGLNFVGNIASVIRSAEIAERAIKAAQVAKNIGSTVGRSGFGGGGGFRGGGGGFRGGGFGGRR